MSATTLLRIRGKDIHLIPSVDIFLFFLKDGVKSRAKVLFFKKLVLSLQPVLFTGYCIKLRLTTNYANNSTVSTQRSRGYR